TRVDDDGTDLLTIAQAGMLPGAAGVGRFVHAVAGCEIRALQAFAAPDVDDVGVRRGYRERANRACGLIIEDRLPGMAVVVSLPDAAVIDADVEDVRLSGDAGCADGSTSAMRPDAAPAQVLIEVGVELL